MKKVILFLVGLVFILLVILGVVLFELGNKQVMPEDNENVENTNVVEKEESENNENTIEEDADLESIKKVLGKNEFFEYELNDKKHILFKIEKSVYLPKQIKIDDAKIVSQDYDGNILKLKMDIKTTETTKEVDANVIIDGIDIDKRFFDIEVEDKFEGLVVDDEEYKSFKGGIVSEDDEFGYVNSEGKFIFELGKYKFSTLPEKVYSDEKNKVISVDNSKYLKIRDEKSLYGIADIEGNILIPCSYKKIIPYAENKFAVTKYKSDDVEKSEVVSGNNEQFGIIDIYNNIVIDFIDGDMLNENFTENMLFILDGKKGLVDRSLNIIVDAKYDDINIESIVVDKENRTEMNYYIVEKDKLFAILYEDQTQLTDFTNTSVYDLKNEKSNVVIEEYNKRK